MYRCVTRNLAVALLGIACLYGQVDAAIDDPELGAKALFYNAAGSMVSVPSKQARPDIPRTSQAKPQVAPPAGGTPGSTPLTLAIRASVLIATVDGLREVKPSHLFRTGDRVKLQFTVNQAGYFYLVALGPTGKTQVLSPRGGERALIQPGHQYRFPASPTAYFKFDQNSGREQLWAVLASGPLDAVDLGNGVAVQVSPTSDSGGKLADGSALVVASAADVMSGKDLVFEEDADAAYASNRPAAASGSAGGHPVVMIKLDLIHK